MAEMVEEGDLRAGKGEGRRMPVPRRDVCAATSVCGGDGDGVGEVGLGFNDGWVDLGFWGGELDGPAWEENVLGQTAEGKIFGWREREKVDWRWDMQRGLEQVDDAECAEDADDDRNENEGLVEDVEMPLMPRDLLHEIHT